MLVARAKVVNYLPPVHIGNVFTQRQGLKEWNLETINLIDAVHVRERRPDLFSGPIE